LADLCEGQPHSEAVLKRLPEFFQVAAETGESGGSSFQEKAVDEEPTDEQAREWLLQYAANMLALSKLCDCEDGVNGAGDPPELHRSNELDNSYGLTISFFSDVHEDKFGDNENPLFYLTEPLYDSGGCTYIIPCYVLWPINCGDSPLDDPFKPAFELWKHGVDWAINTDGQFHYRLPSDPE
jgi:hypothetical protein